MLLTLACRLVALKLKTLEEFLNESEPILFIKRLRSLRHNKIDKELRTAIRHVNEILLHCYPLPKYQIFLKDFVQLCEDMTHSKAISHTFSDDHCLSCRDHCVQGQLSMLFFTHNPHFNLNETDFFFLITFQFLSHYASH